MSVVAGCSLFNGVMLLADCRATLLRPGRKPVYIDNVLKLFALTPTTAIGLVGDITIAAQLLKEGLINLRRYSGSNRVHPIKLLNWFPRYLRNSYARVAKSFNSPVRFMVGSVVLDRPNIVEREKVVQIMERFRLGTLSHQRSWLPNILVQILSTPTNTRFVALMEAPAGLLYIMRSPKFIPEHLHSLEYAAIGSGNQARTEIKRTADWIFAGDVGNPFVESEALRSTVSQFIEQNQIETVEGLYPCLKIDRSGVQMLGIRTEIPIGGATIEITADPSGRWVQRNLSLGREIPLLFPWELDFRMYYQDRKFDDLLEVQRSFRNPQA